MTRHCESLCIAWASTSLTLASQVDSGYRWQGSEPVFMELTGVVVVKQPVLGHRVVCLCRYVWPKRGQCPHSLFVRWLENDREIVLGDLRDMTRGSGPKTFCAINAVERSRARGGGEPVVLPAKSAYQTMDAIAAKARARYEARIKAQGTSKHARALFASPAKRAAAQMQKEESQKDEKKEHQEEELEDSRKDQLRALAVELREPEFRSDFHALQKLSNMASPVWIQELVDSKAGFVLRRLKEDEDTPPPAITLINSVFKTAKTHLETTRANQRRARDDAADDSPADGSRKSMRKS